MPYPATWQVEQAGSQFGLSPDQAYAYAAIHADIPHSSADAQGFLAALAYYTQANLPFPVLQGDTGAVMRYTTAFVTANGTWPVPQPTFIAWLTKVGAWGPGGPTGTVPYAGQGYPPGGAPVTALTPAQYGTAAYDPSTVGTTGATTAAPAPAKAGLLDGITGEIRTIEGDIAAHKTALVVGGTAFLAWKLGLFRAVLGRHRRY